MQTFFNQNISRGQVVFQNYLERAMAEHPLPWWAIPQNEKEESKSLPLGGEIPQKKRWMVVASDGTPIVIECTDWGEAQAIINFAGDTLTLDVLTPR